jgi:hypothetical protein
MAEVLREMHYAVSEMHAVVRDLARRISALERWPEPPEPPGEVFIQ